MTSNVIKKVYRNWVEYKIYGSGWAEWAGDVTWPSSATNWNIAAFDWTTGKLIKDWWIATSSIVKTSWSQTIAGTKTFSTSPVVPSKNTSASSSNKTVIATEAQVALKQDALTLPSTPTSWHIVTWWANNKTLADWWAVPTGTITSVKMNWSTVASSWEADLGTVITSHQSIKTINSNTITWSWNLVLYSSISVTLSSADWSSNTQTVTATWVTASNSVIVSPDPSSIDDYTSSEVYCSAQASNSLTFTCWETPTNNITVNVLILN